MPRTLTIATGNPARQANLLALAALLVSLILAGIGAAHVYGNDKQAIAERVTKTEANQNQQEKRLDRIENKLDALLTFMGVPHNNKPPAPTQP